MRFFDIQIGQQFKFKDGYYPNNHPCNSSVYQKIEPTPPREQTEYDFESKNAEYVDGVKEKPGTKIFFPDEEKSFDCFELVG